jgi:hypothetical protein
MILKGYTAVTSVADPDPVAGAFWPLVFSRSQIPDLTHISEGLVTIFWIKYT